MTNNNKNILDIDIFIKLIKAAQEPVILKVIRYHFYLVFFFPYNKKRGIHNIIMS